jgi:hypothetical protein
MGLSAQQPLSPRMAATYRDERLFEAWDTTKQLGPQAGHYVGASHTMEHGAARRCQGQRILERRTGVDDLKNEVERSIPREKVGSHRYTSQRGDDIRKEGIELC